MTGNGKRLLERVVDDPEMVSVDDIVEAIQSTPPERSSDILRALGRLVAAEGGQSVQVVKRLRPILRDDEEGRRIVASRALSTLSTPHPDVVAAERTAILSRFEDDSPSVRAAGARTLVGLAEDDPRHVLPVLDEVVVLFRDQSLFVIEAALGVVHALLPTHSEESVSLADALIDTLSSPPEIDPLERRTWMTHHPTYREALDRESITTSDRERLLSSVSRTTASVISAHPDAFTGRIPEIAEIVAREQVPGIRSPLLDAIGAIAEQHPVDATEAIDPVSEILSEPFNRELEVKAAWTLAWLAEGDQEAVVTAISEQLPELIESLETTDPELQGGILTLLSHAAERNPRAVDAAIPRVRALVDAEAAVVRAAAVWTLAMAGTDKDRERIGTLARDDIDRTVRETATDALEARGE